MKALVVLKTWIKELITKPKILSAFVAGALIMAGVNPMIAQQVGQTVEVVATGANNEPGNEPGNAQAVDRQVVDEVKRRLIEEVIKK